MNQRILFLGMLASAALATVSFQEKIVDEVEEELGAAEQEDNEHQAEAHGRILPPKTSGKAAKKTGKATKAVAGDKKNGKRRGRNHMRSTFTKS